MTVEIDAQTLRDIKIIINKAHDLTGHGVKLTHIGEAVVAGFGFHNSSVASAALRNTTALAHLDGHAFTARLLALSGASVRDGAFEEAVRQGMIGFWARQQGFGVILGREPTRPYITIAGKTVEAADLSPSMVAQAGTIVTDRNGVVLVIAPVGAGKTTSIMAPTVSEWRGGLVCVDPRMETFPVTVDARRQRQKVYVVDPKSPDSAWFNPISLIPTHSIEAARAVAERLYDRSLYRLGGHRARSAKDEYFEGRARDVVIATMIAVAMGKMHGDDLLTVMKAFQVANGHTEQEAAETRLELCDIVRQTIGESSLETFPPDELEYTETSRADETGRYNPFTFRSLTRMLCEEGFLQDREIPDLPDQTISGIKCCARVWLDFLFDQDLAASLGCAPYRVNRSQIDVAALCRGEASAYLCYDIQTCIQYPGCVGLMLAALMVAKEASASEAPVLFAFDQAAFNIRPYTLSGADRVIANGGRFLLSFQGFDQVDECLGFAAERERIAGVNPTLVTVGEVRGYEHRQRAYDVFGPDVFTEGFQDVVVSKRDERSGAFITRRLRRTPYFRTPEFGMLNIKNPHVSDDGRSHRFIVTVYDDEVTVFDRELGLRRSLAIPEYLGIGEELPIVAFVKAATNGRSDEISVPRQSAGYYGSHAQNAIIGWLSGGEGR